MNINDLKRINEAPSTGIFLVYTQTLVKMGRYAEINDVVEEYSRDNVLEIHLFDSKVEYRALSSTSKRFADGFIEYIADFDADSHVYKECVRNDITFANQPQLTILNHIGFDQNGMAKIDDYRLVEEK